jgi:hypothetical protein
MVMRTKLVAVGVAALAAVGTAGPAHATPDQILTAVTRIVDADRAALQEYATGGAPGITCHPPVATGTQVTPYANYSAGVVFQTDVATSEVNCASLERSFHVNVSTTVVYLDGTGNYVPVPGCFQVVATGYSQFGVAAAGPATATCTAGTGNPAVGASRAVRTGVTVYPGTGYWSYPYVYTPLTA